LSVHVEGPWGQLGELSEEFSYVSRDIRYKSNNLQYDTVEATKELTQVSKIRSAKTDTELVDNWRLPSSANALVARSSSVAPSYHLYTPKYGPLYEIRKGFVSHPDLYADFNLSDVEFQMANLRNKSQTEAMDRLNQGNMELAVTMAEMHKTINHLATVSTRLFSAYFQLRRRDWTGLAKTLGLKRSISQGVSTQAKHWLEFQYAWNPLIMDVAAVYGLAKDGLDKRPTVKAVREVKEPCVLPASLLTWVAETRPGGVDGEMRIVADHIDVEVEIGCKTIIHAEVESRYTQGLKSLGLVNPTAIAWELVPFSFVFDWFVPVGTFLGAVTAPMGMDFLSGTRTEWLSLDKTYASHYGSASSRVFSPHAGESRIEKFVYQRTPLYWYPFPFLYKQGRPLSTKRALTAASLFRVLTDVETSNRELLRTRRI